MRKTLLLILCILGLVLTVIALGGCGDDNNDNTNNNGTVRGVVVSADVGTLLPDTSIGLFRANGTQAGATQQTEADTAAFIFSNVTPGTYYLGLFDPNNPDVITYVGLIGVNANEIVTLTVPFVDETALLNNEGITVPNDGNATAVSFAVSSITPDLPGVENTLQLNAFAPVTGTPAVAEGFMPNALSTTISVLGIEFSFGTVEYSSNTISVFIINVD